MGIFGLFKDQIQNFKNDMKEKRPAVGDISPMWWFTERVLYDQLELNKRYIMQCVMADPNGFGNIGFYCQVLLLDKWKSKFLCWNPEQVKVQQPESNNRIREYTLRFWGDFVLMKHPDQHYTTPAQKMHQQQKQKREEEEKKMREQKIEKQLQRREREDFSYSFCNNKLFCNDISWIPGLCLGDHQNGKIPVGKIRARQKHILQWKADYMPQITNGFACYKEIAVLEKLGQQEKNGVVWHKYKIMNMFDRSVSDISVDFSNVYFMPWYQECSNEFQEIRDEKETEQDVIQEIFQRRRKTVLEGEQKQEFLKWQNECFEKFCTSQEYIKDQDWTVGMCAGDHFNYLKDLSVLTPGQKLIVQWNKDYLPEKTNGISCFKGVQIMCLYKTWFHQGHPVYQYKCKSLISGKAQVIDFYYPEIYAMPYYEYDCRKLD